MNLQFPADVVTLSMLGSLLWPEGIQRFRDLGIRPDDIEDDEVWKIASHLLAGRCIADADLQPLLTRDDGVTMPWINAIDIFDPKRPDWAEGAVERFAYEHARYWFPAWLQWIASEMRAGWMKFFAAAHEVDRLLRLARPCLLREPGKGAPS